MPEIIFQFVTVALLIAAVTMLFTGTKKLQAIQEALEGSAAPAAAASPESLSAVLDSFATQAPEPASVTPLFGESATSATPSDPEEQPFERDGRWWFKRGSELLVFEEGTQEWVAAPTPGPVYSGATMPQQAVATLAAPAQESAGAGWKCAACGAMNGATATSCRMCFGNR